MAPRETLPLEPLAGRPSVMGVQVQSPVAAQDQMLFHFDIMPMQKHARVGGD